MLKELIKRWKAESPNWGKLLFKAATACGILIAAVGEGGELAGIITPESIPAWFKTITGLIIGGAAIYAKLTVAVPPATPEPKNNTDKTTGL